MDAYGGEEQQQTIDYLQKWFEGNKKLPNKIDRILLTRFYYCMYKDVEDTKKLLEINYSIRSCYPHIFIKRDPADEDSRRTNAYADMVPLPGLTPENYRITLLHLHNTDHRMMNHMEDTKAFIMLSDLRFSMPDVIDGELGLLSEGEVQIFDMDGFTMKHLTRLSIRALRAYLKYLQTSFPVRIKAIHMINIPPFIDKVVRLVKPFISREIFEMIHFHTGCSESFFDCVPKELLPDEYGGNAGKLPDIKEKFLKLVSDKRDYLIDPNYWTVQQS